MKGLTGKSTPWLFLGPNLLGFALFTFLPVLFAIFLSFTSWDIFHPPRFVGLENFQSLLGWHVSADGVQMNDPRFWKYLFNTLFLMLAIPLNMAASLFLAVLLQRSIKSAAFFRTVLYLPTVCAGVGLFLLWQYIYNPEFGLLNRGLEWIGIHGPGWLTEYHWAKPALMIMGIWTGMGGTNMILYIAGLQAIPPELYEAASIDGANSVQKFFKITLPMLAPTNFFIFTMAIINGFQGGFEAAYIMTGGGPAGSTMTLSYYIYNHAFQWFNMGYAAAISFVLFVVILLITAINWSFGKRGVDYV